MPATTAVTVSQLNTYVKSLLESDENLNPIFVCGEISNFSNHYRSGHLYMTIKDDSAQIKAVMFRSAAQRLKFMPQNGMSVIILGRVSLYDRDGQYQLYIEQMHPDGVGALSAAYEELKARLSEEGLFDGEIKKEIPLFPERIAVITSKTGAAVQDILNILSRRYPLAEVVMCGVQVQGSAAPAQLISALREVNVQKAADVIIIGRGGGSIEELWAFNDEGVVRAVAASQIPVISAVGHETDYTLCDFAADLRAPTPSAAAELAVPDISELLGRIEFYSDMINSSARSFISSGEMRLAAVMMSRCFSGPQFYADKLCERLEFLKDRICSAALDKTVRCESALSLCAVRLDILNPMRTIARGFAAVSGEQGRVYRAKELNLGERISLIFADGTAKCTVDNTEVINA